MTNAPIKVQAECASCSGTGIYRGLAEPAGMGVVCLHCDGSGAKTVSYVQFTGRKTRTDVQTVSRSKGPFIFAGVGPTGTPVSYADFLKGKMPQ